MWSVDNIKPIKELGNNVSPLLHILKEAGIPFVDFTNNATAFLEPEEINELPDLDFARAGYVFGVNWRL